ncbi:MAG TPA: hypothetical protein VHY22_05810 [Chthoniobacteraceae bacterium]|nr:hypothetical protein [Chthoniobacteraceae bacterium]
MTVDSMNEVVENFRSIYAIISAIAIAEAFNQAVKEREPEAERHASTLRSWFDCIHPTRIVSLVVFLMLAVPFFQGNQRYLYLQYLQPLYSAHPPKTISALWLNFDCLTFSMEAGLFFVMSRSLSARRWQQFYGTIAFLMFVDFVWAVLELWHGAGVPHAWLWFDLAAALALSAMIVIDWRFVRYDRGKQLNIYCFAAVSAIAILGLIYGYFIQLDYLIE